MQKKRVLYFDVLNILACIAVISLHHNGVVHTYSNSWTWKTALIVETGAYWASARKLTTSIRIFVSSVIPAGKTVHLMQFMLNIRRDYYGIYDNRRQKGSVYR